MIRQSGRREPRFDRAADSVMRRMRLVGAGGSGAMGRWRMVCDMFDTTGKLRHLRRTEYGMECEVKLNGCHAADRLTGVRRNDIAAIFEVMAVQAVQDPRDASRAILRLIERDLLVEWAGRPWPGLDAQRWSLWEPVALGWTMLGDPVSFEMTDRPHVLLAGRTRSGKSVCQAMFVATAALSDARLFLFDANRYQLGRWKSVAERFVVDDMDEAASALDGLLGEVDRRFEQIERAGLDKLTADGAQQLGLPLIVVVIDEAADYLRVRGFTDTLTRLCARGAAAGVRVILGTQSPNATIMPTPLRNNFQAVVFGVRDASASRVALGSSSVDASEIPVSQPGVCYLDQDGVALAKARTFYLTSDEVKGLAGRALRARRTPAGPEFSVLRGGRRP